MRNLKWKKDGTGKLVEHVKKKYDLCHEMECEVEILTVPQIKLCSEEHQAEYMIRLIPNKAGWIDVWLNRTDMGDAIHMFGMTERSKKTMIETVMTNAEEYIAYLEEELGKD